MTESFGPRKPEPGVFLQFLILYGDRYQSVHPGGRSRATIKYKIQTIGGYRSKRGRGGCGAPARWLEEGALTSQQQPSRARVPRA
eukprot:6213180-Pleurochrysis_carterae.AAC.1